MLTFRYRQCFMEWNDSQRFAFRPDYPHFLGPYGLIDVYRGFSYDATS